MAKIIFPDVSCANEDGVLAIGGNFSTETLMSAYTQGIFPWPISKEYPIVWFAPNPRGVLEVQQIKINRSLKKALKHARYDFYFNRSFDLVINECASLIHRPKEKATWITPQLISGYTKLFRQGNAYSFEAYEGDDLVAGLYGVVIGQYISAESMFHKKTDASKILLVQFAQFLHTQNIQYIDVQMISPVVESLGGIYISREKFNQYVKSKISEQLPFRFCDIQFQTSASQ